MLIVISRDLLAGEGFVITGRLTVMITRGLDLGNELIACSILLVIRFSLYNTTFF